MQQGNTLATDFAQAQSLTFDFDGTSVRNIQDDLKYASATQVSHANALSGTLASATACLGLDPNVPDDATLAKEFDPATLKYFV